MNELLTMLDTKYKRLEYIESTGTQWIDLGLTANQDTTIKCRASNVNSGTQGFIGLVDTSNLIYGIGQQSENNYLYGQYHKWTSSGGRILSNIAGNDGVIRNFELRKNEFYIDNALIGSITYFTFTTTNTLKLFTLNPSSSISSIKMYNAQVLDGNMNLLRNMIPVLRKSDNEIGMLDLVEGKFYPNAGTGKFTANLDTMYAIIQGTPTVQDGRVSGFSANDYIFADKVLDTSKDFEIVVKGNTGNISVNSNLRVIVRNYFGSSAGQPGFAFGIKGNNKKIQTYLFDTSENLFVNGTLGATVFNNYTDYFFKFSQKLNNGTYTIKIESSTDGTNWIIENSWTHNLPIRNSGQGIAFGGGALNQTAQYWGGTLDLNRSYIKIDDTKYKLQAVVGYTKVGSPTITDGVASGFSSANYLKTPAFSPQNNRWKMVCKFTTGETLPNCGIITGLGTTNSVAPLFITGQAMLSAFFSSNGTSWDIANSENILAPQPNTTYIIEIEFTGNSYKFYSYENNIWVLKKTIISSKQIYGTIPLVFGNNRGQSLGFNGSIDLNNTYIKINNKLWFNGLPQ